MELLTTHTYTRMRRRRYGRMKEWKEGRGRKWLVLTGKLVKEILVCGLVCVCSPVLK